MATIDPNIALGYQPVKIENPINQYAAMSKIEGGQNANALAQYQLSAAKRGDEKVNFLNQVFADSTDPITGKTDYARVRSAAAKGGFGSYIPELIKQQQGEEKESNLIQKGKVDLAKAQHDFSTQIHRDLSSDPSDEKIIQNFNYYKNSGLFNADQIASAEVTARSLLGMPLQNRFAVLASQGASASDLKPVIQNTELGGNVITRAFNPYSGAPTTISDIKKTMTPGDRAVDQRAKENQGLQYGENVVANTVTDAAGNVTQFNRFGKIIGTPGAVGKPSATFEKTQALQKQLGTNLDTAIREITDAIKPGGVLEKATGSGMGKAVDATMGFFGKATEGAINSAKLKPVADLALKVIPRFEGPQSDKDTASYKEAAGELGNELLPIEIRRAAGETVVRLMRERKNQFSTQAMETEGISTNAGVPSLDDIFKPKPKP
jgi:hypothetical protein